MNSLVKTLPNVKKFNDYIFDVKKGVNPIRLKNHPIAELYRNGIDVTINSDDVLICDSDVSKEYLRLYQCGCLNADELDDIRKSGLKPV